MQKKTTHKIAVAGTVCILLILTTFARHNARKHAPRGKKSEPPALRHHASHQKVSQSLTAAKKRHQSLRRRPTRTAPPPAQRGLPNPLHSIHPLTQPRNSLLPISKWSRIRFVLIRKWVNELFGLLNIS